MMLASCKEAAFCLFAFACLIGLVSAVAPITFPLFSVVSTSLNDCEMIDACGRKQYFLIAVNGETSSGGNKTFPSLTWDAAYGYCSEANGRMAIVRNAADDALMRAQTGLNVWGFNRDAEYYGFWLGGRRADTNSPFYWVDGTPVEPPNGGGPWLTGFPNTDNDEAADDGDEDETGPGTTPIIPVTDNSCLSLATGYSYFDDDYPEGQKLGWVNTNCDDNFAEDDEFGPALSLGIFYMYAGVICECPDRCSA